MIRRHPVLGAVTAVYLVALAFVTLTPAKAGSGGVIRAVLEALARFPLTAGLTPSGLEFTANILMFVPMGLLFTLLLGIGRWWLALAIGVASTCLIEGAQLFIPSRFSDLRDIVANTLGTLAGIGLVVCIVAIVQLRPARE